MFVNQNWIGVQVLSCRCCKVHDFIIVNDLPHAKTFPFIFQSARKDSFYTINVVYVVSGRVRN